MLRVLVPCDGTANSQYGVRHVVGEFLKNRDLEIHLLNVQRPFSKHVGRFASQRARIEFHQEQAEAALKPARRALDSSGIPYTVHTEVGNKADCIADAARRLHCDRIVMSTARKSSLVRWVEDSVTNKVVERTTVPVEVIAGDPASSLERVGIPAGIGAGLVLVWMAVD
ncbi:MAG: universal stress protein [Burkholderiaceae bacterium]|nr:universal stress protein [Burkholderiaceae bacterium]